MIIEWLVLGRCEHTPGVTAHYVPESVARTLDHSRITFADRTIEICSRSAPHLVHTYDVEKTR